MSYVATCSLKRTQEEPSRTAARRTSRQSSASRATPQFLLGPASFSPPLPYYFAPASFIPDPTLLSLPSSQLPFPAANVVHPKYEARLRSSVRAPQLDRSSEQIDIEQETLSQMADSDLYHDCPMVDVPCEEPVRKRRRVGSEHNQRSMASAATASPPPVGTSISSTESAKDPGRIPNKRKTPKPDDLSMATGITRAGIRRNKMEKMVSTNLLFARPYLSRLILRITRQIPVTNAETNPSVAEVHLEVLVITASIVTGAALRRPGTENKLSPRGKQKLEIYLSHQY